MASDETNGRTTDPLGRRRLVARWAAAGVLLPACLGGLSWICFEARLGALFDVFANLSMFTAPLWPLGLKAFQGRGAPGLAAYAVAGGIVAFNALLYASVGVLQWRLRAQPRANRLIWLTVAVGLGFSVLKFAALILAFSGS